MADNTLYYGDNLDILGRYVKDECVDLVYLNPPPFNSNATYNVLFGELDGTQAASQIKAFEDTWRWDASAAATYQDTVEMGGQVSRAMQAFRTVLGEKYHARLSRHDGPVSGRVAVGDEANGEYLSALRSHGQPLSQNVDVCSSRCYEFL